jgi:hypothetical protein
MGTLPYSPDASNPHWNFFQGIFPRLGLAKKTRRISMGRTPQHDRVTKKTSRKPPVRIPLPFERAIEGLLAVQPRKKKRKKKPKAATG